MQISQSDLVRVRRRRWRVIDIRAYERCQVLTLAGVEPANDGLERRFVAPFDVIEPIERRSRLTPVSRRLWRRACRALIAADTPPGALASARLAKIDLLPHQLEPALAVVRGLGLAPTACRRCRTRQDDPGGVDRGRAASARCG